MTSNNILTIWLECGRVKIEGEHILLGV